jgi:hypothetical protein
MNGNLFVGKCTSERVISFRIFPKRRRACWWSPTSPRESVRFVAGGRNAPNMPVLVLPYRFELIREVAA